MKTTTALMIGLALTVPASPFATDGMAQPARHNADKAVVRSAFRAEVDAHRFTASRGRLPATPVESLQSDPPGPEGYYGPNGFSWEPHGWWGMMQ